MTQPAYRFQFLAPLESLPIAENGIIRSSDLYNLHLRSLQQLRGSAYLHDGAIQPSQLNARGGYCMTDDESCWHFLLVDQREQAIGCARYLVHPKEATYNQLRISQSPLAQDPHWGGKLRETVESTLQQTRRDQVRYAELGGWAIADEYRNTKAALEILLASYLWAEMIGHCVCSCTATSRNHSSSILRRVGANSLLHNGEPLPPYFDSQYGCVMEVLAFDSRKAPLRFAPLLSEMRSKLVRSPILQLDLERAPSFMLHRPNFGSPIQTSSFVLDSQAGTQTAAFLWPIQQSEQEADYCDLCK